MQGHWGGGVRYIYIWSAADGVYIVLTILKTHNKNNTIININ